MAEIPREIAALFRRAAAARARTLSLALMMAERQRAEDEARQARRSVQAGPRASTVRPSGETEERPRPS